MYPELGRGRQGPRQVKGLVKRSARNRELGAGSLHHEEQSPSSSSQAPGQGPQTTGFSAGRAEWSPPCTSELWELRGQATWVPAHPHLQGPAPPST